MAEKSGSRLDPAYVVAWSIWIALFVVQQASAEWLRAVESRVTSDSGAYALVRLVRDAQQPLAVVVIASLIVLWLFLGFFLEMIRAMRGGPRPGCEGTPAPQARDHDASDRK